MPLWLLANWKLILGGIAIAAAAYGGHWITKRVYQGEIAAIELAHEKALVAAITKAQADQRAADAVTLDLTVAEADGQERIVTKFRNIIEEVPIYVQDTSACITYGLIRLLDAAALGADPKDLLLPASEYNENCAPVKATDLAKSVVRNYEAAHANAQQLTSLQTWAADVARLSGAP